MTFEANIRRKMNLKREILSPHIKGDCLHLGFVGGNESGEQEDYWMHGWLEERSSRLVGIDVNKKGVEYSRKEGYEVYQQNADDFDISGEFDTIVATNIIEHVPNPGKLLFCSKEHLKNGGNILVTTPRPFIPWNLLREIYGGIEPHDEHKMWFCKNTMKCLVESQELRISHYERWGNARRIGTNTLDKIWTSCEKFLCMLGFEDLVFPQHYFIVKE